LLDGRSRVLVLRELFTLYEALCQGKRLDLKPALSYRAYISWLQTQDLSKAEAFWKNLLQGFTTPTRLAIAQATRAASTAAQHEEMQARLSDELTSTLLDRATQNQLTLNTILQGAWALLLSRYSNQDDVVFGVTRAGRRSIPSETAAMAGLFINTIPVRVRLSPDDSLIPWLKAIRAQHLAVRDYEHTPLILIQNWSQAPRGTSLFESVVVFDNCTLHSVLKAGGGEWRNREFSLNQQSNYPLMRCGYLEADLLIRLEYDRDQFSQPMIARLLHDLQTVLQAIAEDPDRKLLDIDVLSREHRHQILVEYTDTAKTNPADCLIHELFENQVTLTSERTALVCDEAHLSYAQLNARANQLAHYLREMGAGPDQLVGICLERSIDQVVAILAVLKSGAAYLPLDPIYPVQRLAYIIEDSGIQLMLSRQMMRSMLPQHDIRQIDLDAEADEINRRSEGNPVRLADGDHSAYVIYTSGSTGLPKGSIICHKSVANLFTALEASIYRESPPGPLRVSLNGPVAFDTSVKQLVQLLAGHALYMVSEEARKDPEQLLAFINSQSLDVLDCTPSMLDLLINCGLLKQERRPALILLGGEAIDKATWQLLAGTEKKPFHNVYGPTECTVNATTHHITEPAETSIIGRPIANVKLYLLDRYLRTVPKGVMGELYITGEAVGRGYLNRAALTAEKFVANPYSSSPGERMYGTGDLCRYREDGQLEYLGRADDLVKVRGYRIELGEIEIILNQHNTVTKSVVVVREDAQGEKRLVAYVVSEDDSPAPSVTELRRHLQQKLPEFMTPSVFVMMDSLPLTPNGKVDRRALPLPELKPRVPENSDVEPLNVVEEILAGIWSEVLRVERISIEDNFFELGGHSLLGIQVLSRIRRAFQIEMSLHSLFEAPTVAGLAELVKRTMSTTPPQTVSPIKRVPREQWLRLSSAQERLWFLDNLRARSSAYNIPSAMRLKGQLEVAALEQCLSEIVRRHEVLRTSFALHEGQPVQVIQAAAALHLAVADLGGLSDTAREAEVRRLASQEAGQPFDLSGGPVLRARLLKLAIDEHVLLLSLHHIASDGWSTAVLVREMVQLYESYSKGEASGLAELVIQYADYAQWQRDLLAGEGLKQQLDYWRAKLGGEQEGLSLPTDRARPAVQSERGSRQALMIKPATVEGLKRVSRGGGVTLFMTLMAAFKVLLSRYSGQQEVVVGTPIAGRNYAETEGLIGFFVNMLALKTDLSGDPKFSELLVREREVALGGYLNQEVPFERLVEELQPERDRSRAPLFQVVFALQNAPREHLKIAGVQVSPLKMEIGTTHFELSLAVTESEQGLSGVIEYSTDLFDEATIERMSCHYENLLGGAVADEGQRLSELPMMSEAERRQVLREWNETAAEYERERSIKEMIEEQAEQAGERVAVVYEGEHVTYGELNRRANQLANYLRRRGVGPEEVVGICMARSVEMVVGLVGIVKAGGAYLPLDPGYPTHRLAYMLKDAQAKVLLGVAEMVAPLVEGMDQKMCTAIELDTRRAEIVTESQENCAAWTTAGNLAYVIYTSGSTGVPKGIGISHEGLMNLVNWHQQKFEVSSDDRATQMAGVSFDASVWEIWPYLGAGASIQIVDDETRATPEKLQTWLVRNEITITFVPTPLAESVLRMDWPACAALRVMLTGGDKLHHRPSQTVGFEVVNNYGPSENSVVSTSGLVKASQENEEAPTIGRAIANTRVYIVQGYGIVPSGAPGELWIAGNGLARGYLNRPELTAERFIPDGFSGDSGARVYRSGDIGRHKDNGEIEFIGRTDEQVKIRGHRIEPGEVEAMLVGHAGISGAVVIPRDDEAGEKRLVAYVVRGPHPGPDAAHLRGYLKGKLPAYMVPSAFVFLEQMPQTVNGKLDRRALPAVRFDERNRDRLYVAPRNPTEEMVAGIWADILGLEQVSVFDDFFESGGHSLKATRIVSRLRSAFNIDLSLATVFETTTVAGLAEAIETGLREQQGISAPPIAPASRETQIPLSFSQQRLWFLDQLDPGNTAYNSAFALRLAGPLSVAALQSSISQIIQRHEALRTCIGMADGIPLQIISAPTQMAIPLINLKPISPDKREAEARRIIIQQAGIAFDLKRGPLLRAALIQLDDADHALMLIAHHIIFDGWSLGVFMQELAALYQASLAGVTAKLSELAIQYADYAYWQRQWLKGETLEKQIGYWKRQLEGNVRLNLPVITGVDDARLAGRVAQRIEPPRGGYAIYDPAGRVSSAFVALDRTARYFRRHAGRRPQSARA
jgi:amino acid adenylation domain-containing protein